MRITPWSHYDIVSMSVFFSDLPKFAEVANQSHYGCESNEDETGHQAETSVAKIPAAIAYLSFDLFPTDVFAVLFTNAILDLVISVTANDN